MKNAGNEVDRFLEKKQHPLDAEIRKVREIIMSVDDRISEGIKWSSPTFMYKGNIASFFMNAKNFVSLMFHKGALIDNADGLLEGDGKESRVARFQDMADIEKKQKALVKVIQSWIQIQDSR